jgi:hypothetical protein
MFTKINLTYTFGRNPCYCNIGKWVLAKLIKIQYLITLQS